MLRREQPEQKRLKIEGNAFYEIDLNCMKRKQERMDSNKKQTNEKRNK